MMPFPFPINNPRTPFTVFLHFKMLYEVYHIVLWLIMLILAAVFKEWQIGLQIGCKSNLLMAWIEG